MNYRFNILLICLFIAGLIPYATAADGNQDMLDIIRIDFTQLKPLGEDESFQIGCGIKLKNIATSSVSEHLHKRGSVITYLAAHGSKAGNNLVEILVKGSFRGAYIDLEGNNIGDEGAIALADLLITNSSITTLILDRNNIGPKGLLALVEALRFNVVLESLGLVGNPQIKKHPSRKIIDDRTGRNKELKNRVTNHVNFKIVPTMWMGQRDSNSSLSKIPAEIMMSISHKCFEDDFCDGAFDLTELEKDPRTSMQKMSPELFDTFLASYILFQGAENYADHFRQLDLFLRQERLKSLSGKKFDELPKEIQKGLIEYCKHKPDAPYKECTLQ
jgi:hypothetical protein